VERNRQQRFEELDRALVMKVLAFVPVRTLRVVVKDTRAADAASAAEALKVSLPLLLPLPLRSRSDSQDSTGARRLPKCSVCGLPKLGHTCLATQVAMQGANRLQALAAEAAVASGRRAVVAGQKAARHAHPKRVGSQTERDAVLGTMKESASLMAKLIEDSARAGVSAGELASVRASLGQRLRCIARLGSAPFCVPSAAVDAVPGPAEEKRAQLQHALEEDHTAALRNLEEAQSASAVAAVAAAAARAAAGWEEKKAAGAQEKKKCVKWTAAEVEALKDGVQQHGVGKWQEILAGGGFQHCRTNFHLGNKWKQFK
jgi:hypothetical protein